MLWRPADGFCRADLHHPTQIKHDNPVADEFDNIEIVADEQHRHAEAVTQVLQQVEDLRLYGNVKRRNRFIGDNELGFNGERARDTDALPLAAREFVRKTVGVFRLETDHLQKRSNAGAARSAGRQTMRVERFADDR